MDDEPMVGKVIRKMLAECGCAAALTCSGSEAVKLFMSAKSENKPFDAVILDLNIPRGMQGDETLEQIRALDPDVKAILLTGDISHPVVSCYEDRGFKTVLLKPFTKSELEQAIQLATTE